MHYTGWAAVQRSRIHLATQLVVNTYYYYNTGDVLYAVIVRVHNIHAHNIRTPL